MWAGWFFIFCIWLHPTQLVKVKILIQQVKERKTECDQWEITEPKMPWHKALTLVSSHSILFQILRWCFSCIIAMLHRNSPTVEADWVENLRWDHTESYVPFRWVHTEPFVHFRKANTEPSMHFRKANTEPSMHFRKANTEISKTYLK